MNIAIVTNMNGIGLTRDYELLRDFLQNSGHTTVGLQYDDDSEIPDEFKEQCDLAIFLEVIPRNMLELAPVRWAFLNPEWCTPEIVKTAQRHMNKIFAKTHEAKRIFDEVFTGKVYYTGFMARDQYDETAIMEPVFLHVGGNSSIRGTQAVLDAWKWRKDGKKIESEIYVISRTACNLEGLEGDPRVHFFETVPEGMLKELQNSCKFHLYPSGTEGFGHALHEAFSVGAFVLTTDAPPMNELEHVYEIPAVGQSKYNLADVYEVSALDIFEGTHQLLELSKHTATQHIFSRYDFLDANEEFKGAFSAHLEQFNPRPAAPAIRVKGDGLQIAFIGNFKAEHSTENQIKWALEEGLGHDVEMLQENEVNLAAIRSAMEFSDLLLWVRTPGWLCVNDREMLELLASVKIPTVSVHLDKFWGIPEREALIGVHPFWKTKFVFTADGSRQDDFKARGVNHFWMRPAVSEVYCHPGTPWDMYRCDVGFVGAREYHNEYPFRAQLVDFLEKTYGYRFKHITGLRGHGLNDFYASCKVVVGDCIFAGTPNYWSDRVPETCGRYGFLLHPLVLGLNVPVGAIYIPKDLDDLKKKIEMSLYWTEPQRKNIIKNAADWIKRNDTWTVRMEEIIEIVL